MKALGDYDPSAAVNAIADKGHLARQQGATNTRQFGECGNCGWRHDLQRRESCPAHGKTCNKCHKLNHFAAKCRSRNFPTVRPVTGTEESEDTNEIFQMHTASRNLDDSQFVTLRLVSGNYVRFLVDSGVQCNVIPLGIYKKATKDKALKHVTSAQMRITAYGGATLPVVGTVLLQVWRGDFHCRLACKLVDRKDIHPLLGRKACIGMRIVSYLDNDQINQPQTGDTSIYAIEKPGPQSIEQLVEKFPTVFSKGVGLLEGKYHIRLDDSIEPAQHSPRCVHVPLWELLRRTLSDLIQQGIVAPVQEPTQWISSMVLVPRKNGTLRICLDPKDLNRAIMREHYPLPTIEEVATPLHGVKVFCPRCELWVLAH